MDNSAGRHEGNLPDRKRIQAGALFLIAFAQLLFFTGIAEGLYPGYNVRMNFISDLGVEPQSAFLFSSSMMLTGILVIAGSLLLFTGKERTGKNYALAFIILTGVGLAGVAAFNENAFRTIHLFFAGIAFASGGISVVLCSLYVHQIFKYISLVLGGVMIIGIIFIAGAYVVPSLESMFRSIGPGFSERFVAYPEAIWFMAFGAYLIGSGNRDSP